MATASELKSTIFGTLGMSTPTGLWMECLRRVRCNPVRSDCTIRVKTATQQQRIVYYGTGARVTRLTTRYRRKDRQSGLCHAAAGPLSATHVRTERQLCGSHERRCLAIEDACVRHDSRGCTRSWTCMEFVVWYEVVRLDLKPRCFPLPGEITLLQQTDAKEPQKASGAGKRLYSAGSTLSD